MGAIGLGVIQTSNLIKASRIIAVDTNPGKKAWAMKMGATDFVNPATLPDGKKIQDYLVEITDGGLDYTFDCTGNVSTSAQGFGRLLMVFVARSARFTLCEQRWRHATRAGGYQPLSVSPLPVKRSLLARKSYAKLVRRRGLTRGGKIPIGNRTNMARLCVRRRQRQDRDSRSRRR